MGPTTKTISVTGGVTFEDLADSYHTQAAGLIEGDVDVLLLETGQDTLNIKAGLEGIDRAFAELGREVPVAVQGTVEPMGTLLAGQDVEALYISLSHRDLLWIGINCATGPAFMTDHIRTLASISRFPVACVPNAGMPDEDGKYNETPEAMAETLGRFVDSGWVNLVGGCCGTENGHIHLLGETAAGKVPRKTVESHETRVSGIDSLLVDDQLRPAVVGERTNVLGSRRFRRLINEGKFEEAAEIGRRQARNGAHILDVCLQDPDRDEAADVAEFLDLVTKKVKTPIMIDSTDSAVIELSLKRLQGKAIINSVNLEDGEERFQAVVPLARRFGAALVVGCIDDDKEQAQAVTRERKLEVALRSAKLLDREVRRTRGGPDLRSPGLPGGYRRRQLHRFRRRDRGGCAADQGGAASVQDRAGHFQRVLRPARRRARGAEFGVPVPLRAGRPGHGHRQLRADDALCQHPRGGA